MRRISLLLAALAGLFAAASTASPAQAQLIHTWIASNGSDAANCDRPTPCATLAGAYPKTTAGGEISCVDGGNYSGLTITKSITINCENGNTFLLSFGLSGFYVNTAATDIVTLRGLDLDGSGSSSSGYALIVFVGAGVLHVDKMKINNLRGSDASGISFTPGGRPSSLSRTVPLPTSDPAGSQRPLT
jgi:nitrous oxidase accessory protein NosD